MIPAVGDRAAPRTYGPVSRTDIVRFAGASGDFQPVHHDETVATAAGHPTVFAMGMFQGSLLATYAADWLGAEAIRRLRLRFTERVWPGDRLTCAGSVVAVEPVAAGTAAVEPDAAGTAAVEPDAAETAAVEPDAAETAAVEPEAGGTVVTVRLRCHRQTGATVVTGEAEFLL